MYHLYGFERINEWVELNRPHKQINVFGHGQFVNTCNYNWNIWKKVDILLYIFIFLGGGGIVVHLTYNDRKSICWLDCNVHNLSWKYKDLFLYTYIFYFFSSTYSIWKKKLYLFLNWSFSQDKRKFCWITQ